jgi:xanthine dehydrogenase D subunit
MTIDTASTLIGKSVQRRDVPSKIDGSFEFSNDVVVPGMLFGATVRSPYAHARLLAIDSSLAVKMTGVVKVLTISDVPTNALTGHIFADQPAFVDDVARYEGEPVAFVVAETQELAWKASDAIKVSWQPLTPTTDPRAALDDTAPLVHPQGNLIRSLTLRRGLEVNEASTADCVVTGYWETGRQDQAFLAPESAVAIPDPDGGVTLILATQDLHTDQTQIASVLGLPEEQVRLVMSGIGGAFGGREDITCQIHLALAALTTGRPVKTTYRRGESFLAHPNRHPAQMRYRLGADNDGQFQFLHVDLLLDGGPYASTSGPVLGSASYFAAGPYRIPSVHINGRAARTNNPVSGAMRGFGAVQACFGMESTVDLLAAALSIDPIELRRRNVLQAGDEFPTSGQLVGPSAPLHELIDQCVAIAPPVSTSLSDQDHDHPYQWPGGTGLSTQGEDVRRGVGFALGVKNHLYGEGTPEWSVATIELSAHGATVFSAAAEVGQGVQSVLLQIASHTLGGLPTELGPVTAAAGYSGSSSASRQTWMSGAAVLHAATEIATQLRSLAASRHGVTPSEVTLTAQGVSVKGVVHPLCEVLSEPLSFTAHYSAPVTQKGDPTTGQGDIHVSWMFVAHRATVDVDTALGISRVVQIATAQDVGRAINPREVYGQIAGAVTQGIGLALNEHLSTVNGQVTNNSFTDYLIPTAADTPSIEIVLVEVPDPHAPFGLKGVGEPGSISSTAAVAAAIRNATGRAVPRVPVRPDDLI